MRILFVGNYARDRQESMLRYGAMLAREMAGRGHAVRLLKPPMVLGKIETGRESWNKWLGYVDKYLLFPPIAWLASRRADVAHVCDHSNSMYLPWLPRDRRSITCHDVLAIRSAEGAVSGRKISRTGRAQQAWIKRHLVKAERVVAISRETARQLREMGAKSEITVILNPTHAAIEPVTDAAKAAVRARAGLAEGERYLLHVGANSWYKNRPGVLKIFSALVRRPEFAVLRLVMAGKKWTDELRTLNAGLPKPALEVVGLSDAEIHALYAGAEALLFPSLAEGFGWPVLEAQVCGCPVITSNREPMMEVAGGSALLIDPVDPEGAAETIARGWDGLPALREAGRRNLERFDRTRTLDEYERFLVREATEASGGVRA